MRLNKNVVNVTRMQFRYNYIIFDEIIWKGGEVIVFVIRKELSTKEASTHVKKPDALFQARRENVEGEYYLDCTGKYIGHKEKKIDDLICHRDR